MTTQDDITEMNAEAAAIQAKSAGIYVDASGTLHLKTGGSARGTVDVAGVATGVFTGGSSTAVKALSGFTQATHGFTVGALTPVRFNATSFVKAVADNLTDATAVFIAVASDANTFDLYGPGLLTTTGATPGTQWLHPTVAGTMTGTQPSTPGQVSMEMGVYISATQFIFSPKAAEYIAPTPYGKQILDASTAITVATLGRFQMPSDLVGATLFSAEITVSTAPSTNAVEVDVKNNAGTTVFATKPQIATAKRSSASAGGTAAVITATTANAVVAQDDVWVVSGTIADATTAADRGLSVWLRFK
jgi:hypothetical protein